MELSIFSGTPMTVQSHARPLLLSGFLLLAGCGGGGSSPVPGNGAGNGGANGNSPTTSSNGVTVTVDKTALRLVSMDNRYEPEAKISFSMSGGKAGATYYAMTESDGKAVIDTYIDDSSLTSLRLNLRSRRSLGPTDGTIKFKLCEDEKCNVVAWSRSLPYSIRNYQVDTSEVRLAGYQGGENTVVRTITPTPDGDDLTVTTNSTESAKWLSSRIDANGAQAITGSGNGFPQGSYAGNVVLSPKHSGPGVGMPVAMQLGSGVALPAGRTVRIDAPPPAQNSGTIDLAFQGNQAPTWEASSDKPWLQLHSSSGTGSTKLAYNIDVAKLGTVTNFSTDSATVTIKAAGLATETYTISVDKRLPEITVVTPSFITAGKDVQLRLRGRGLAQLASIGAIRIDNQPVSTGSIASDTEALVSLRSMSPGAHPIAIELASGRTAAPASVNVVDAASTAPAFIPGAGFGGVPVYDQARGALYVVDKARGALLSYRQGAGGWTLHASVPVENYIRLGLSHDGSTLYATNGERMLDEREPVTLALRASYTGTARDLSMGDGGIMRALPITSDGRIWFSRSQWSEMVYFDTRSKSFNTVEPQRLLDDLRYVVSGDGSRMFAITSVNSIHQPMRYGTALSADARDLLHGASKLYDASTMRILGSLPDAIGGKYGAALLSPTGDRIYVSIIETTPADKLVVARFDVFDAPSMTKVGEVPLPQRAANCTDAATYDCDFWGSFVISPFRDALIWTGNKGIAFAPIPAALRRARAPSRFKLVR